MPAPKKNQFWKARAKSGRAKIFTTPAQLRKACVEYFQWVEDNPLYESKLTSYKGVNKIVEVPKMRAMTIGGLCMFLGVNEHYLRQFEDGLKLETRKGEDFSLVIREVRAAIREQKFTGAAADLLNANIIARDLGLADKTEITKAQVIIPTGDMTADEASDAYKQLMES